MRPLQDSTVAIIGLGLMGGSLALALRKEKACRELLGVERNPDTRALALSGGVMDDVGPDLDLVTRADLVVLATPVQTILELLPVVGNLVREGTVILDQGSTKREIVRAMQALPAFVQPVGGHPMCGKESSGFAAAEANLYRDAPFVLTPLPRTHPDAVALVDSLVRAVAARPILVDPERHDRIVAATSHLPFAIASALMTLIGEFALSDDLVLTLTAGGLRDTSRLAASDTSMMLDVLLTNADNVSDLIRAYSALMTELADLIASRDEAALRSLLQAAAKQRRGVWH